jgi:hypothetical protein
MTEAERNALRKDAALRAMECTLRDPYLREFTEATAAFCWQVGDLMVKTEHLSDLDLESIVAAALAAHAVSEGK